MGLGQTKRNRLDPEVRSYIETIEQSIEASEQRNRNWEARYEQLVKEYHLLLYKRFGRSSEQDASQPQLFEESEQIAETEKAETLTVATHQRKKVGRKPIDENVPRVEILHDISDEDKMCGCGHQLERIGEEVSERMQVIPERMYAERHTDRNTPADTAKAQRMKRSLRCASPRRRPR